MSRQILAIDIRNNAVAFVLLNSGIKSNTVLSAGYVQYNGETGDESPTVRALKSIYEQTNAVDASVVVALPADLVFYRNVSIPFREIKKIQQVLPFELEPQLPVSVDQLVTDFQPKAHDHEDDLLAVAISRTELENYKRACSENGLPPQMIVPGSFPLALMLLSCSDQLPDHALILDCDLEKSTLYALMDGNIRSVRSVPSSFSDDAALELFALRIRQTLTALNDFSGNAFTPKKIFVSGPVAEKPDFVQSLSKVVDIPSVFIDIRTCLPKVEQSETLPRWQAGLLDNALSLAMIESKGDACPNFHRSSSALRNYWSNYKTYLKAPAVLLSCVLAIGLTSVLADISLLQSRVNQINGRMEKVFAETFPGTKRVGVEADKQMESELKKLKSASPDPEQGASAVRNIDILYEISRLIPKDVEILLKRVVASGDSVTLSGETSAFTVVDDVKVRLQQSPLFKAITIASANMDKTGNTVRFKLKIDL